MAASDAPTSSTRDAQQRSSQPGLRVAYMMSRFPKLTETFILQEMIQLEALGVTVEVFPLRRHRTRLIQPAASPYVARAHFTPFVSWGILLANFRALLTRPRLYLEIIFTLLRANWGSRRYLTGALVFFPKAVYLAERMQRAGVQHIHAHFASHPAAVAWIIHRLSGLPYSFVAHGSDLHRDQHMLAEKTADAAFVAAISNYNRDMIVDVCEGKYAEKVRVLHCGVDAEQFSARQSPTSFDLGEGPLQIVCIGTLHEVKGQKHLVEACRLLKETEIAFHCHFLGGGPDLAELQQQVSSAALSAEVTFHGACTSQSVRERLWEADVLVAPSVFSRDGRREGIPVVLMEAMACGVPCVASAISGIPELVEDGVTGILTEPADSGAIATALRDIAMDERLREQFQRNSVDKVKREFDLAESAKRLARLIAPELSASLPPSPAEPRSVSRRGHATSP